MRIGNRAGSNVNSMNYQSGEGVNTPYYGYSQNENIYNQNRNNSNNFINKFRNGNGKSNMPIGNRPRKLKRGNQKSVTMAWIVRIICLVGALVFSIWAQNNLLIVNDYIYTSYRVPKTFVGYNIVHISDVNNTSLNVASKVRSCDPDIILVTGGFSNDDRKVNKSIKTLNKLADIAPTYVIFNKNDSGNVIEQLEDAKLDAEILHNDSVSIEAPDVDTDDFMKKYLGKRVLKQATKEPDSTAAKYVEYTENTLKEDRDAVIKISGLELGIDDIVLESQIYSLIGTDKDILQVVMTGEPDRFSSISNTDIDILLAGSLLGQQSGDLSKGIYNRNGTTLFLSNGIGNNKQYPNRFFNFPSINSIVLSDGTIKNENPLEKILGYFINDVETKFDNDGGFKEYTYSYNNFGSVKD